MFLKGIHVIAPSICADQNSDHVRFMIYDDEGKKDFHI